MKTQRPQQIVFALYTSKTIGNETTKNHLLNRINFGPQATIVPIDRISDTAFSTLMRDFSVSRSRSSLRSTTLQYTEFMSLLP